MQVTQAMIVFFMVGLEFTAIKFIRYLVFLSLAASSGAFMGFIVGIHTSDLKRTQEILTPLLMPMMLFSGYMLPYPQLPVYLRWLYWISIYQYIFSGLVLNHFEGLEFKDCNFNILCFSKGEYYLDALGLNPGFLYNDLLICIGWLIFLVILGFVVLHRAST
jgi:ABC-type multidrug transport system permease subunit